MLPLFKPTETAGRACAEPGILGTKEKPMGIRLLHAVIVALVLLTPCTAAAQPSPVRIVPSAEAPSDALQWHVLVGENWLVDGLFLGRHTHDANGGGFGDNVVIADFWYDATHRRIHTRSIQLGEVDDPADLRLGRAAGVFPNRPDFRKKHHPGTVVGHVGFVTWNHNGFGAYFAAVQGAQLNENTGILCLSTAPGVPGRDRWGSSYAGDELVCHVALMPNGDVVIGYNTDPATTPRVIIRGDLIVTGRIIEEQR
jgi:hypothetical protein